MESLNMKEVSDNSFEPLPEDRYHLEIDKVELTESKAKKTPQLNFTTTVQSGETTEDTFTNRKLWVTIAWTEKSAGVMKGFLRAIGSPLIEEENLTPDLIIEDAPGRLFSAWVEQETYNDKTRNKVSNFKAIEGGEDSAPATGGNAAGGKNLFD